MILPSRLTPDSTPKFSPSVTRTAGANATIVLISGSASQSIACSVSSFSPRAPVGHTSAHCPHCTHVGLSAQRSAPVIPTPHIVPMSLIVKAETLSP
ncbi:unknown [Sutterella sp. CAG:397]|nr:unknown [Sutterella sp. CAG:397]